MDCWYIKSDSITYLYYSFQSSVSQDNSTAPENKYLHKIYNTVLTPLMCSISHFIISSEIIKEDSPNAYEGVTT